MIVQQGGEIFAMILLQLVGSITTIHPRSRSPVNIFWTAIAGPLPRNESCTWSSFAGRQTPTLHRFTVGSPNHPEPFTICFSAQPSATMAVRGVEHIILTYQFVRFYFYSISSDNSVFLSSVNEI